ncbi:unnamed protein product [Rotaria socialis]|uniref:Uncharacterized protein n=1 Tax=Rotaria socialis TaxID=392032 RepID=A0A820E464_9BILA|nr:unnamed protein product [Rotaria socialis]CAF3466880.1 unnamed protein product [Rotaria socialis]CAF4241156.1 unnamed protein product [Rotaria socialis]CAF4550758.1 unnamed protein product [Rotaria socialis]
MRYYYYSIIILIFILDLAFTWPTPSIIKSKKQSLKNVTSLNIHQRTSVQADKLRNITTSTGDRFTYAHKNEEEEIEYNDTPVTNEISSVVVLTSLTGVYVWWPAIFGGDDSFHILLTQEDVPRFHDVTGDDQGNIYLTAPHERTVYRLEYLNGWWISNFSNYSVMNSIRSEMPLFVDIHYVSSILYVYGHSDIQIIDLLQKPRTRGSAPFMKRLRELSPNLRITDMIIDQLTSDGYILGDSYGWCTVIRCSLTVNECVFLFKIPTSHDNRPYPCTASIDFSSKIMYLSLEEKVLVVHLNEQTNFDRKQVLTEKRGPRSTLGYDDIVNYNNFILYTDVLRPLLHICTLKNANPCITISLRFPFAERSILPLRLSIIRVSNLQPPISDDENDAELQINESTTILPPLSLLMSNKTTELQRLIDHTSIKPYIHEEITANKIWILILGIFMGLIFAGLSFLVYYIIWNKNRPKLKKDFPPIDSKSSSIKTSAAGCIPLLNTNQSNDSKTRNESSKAGSTDSHVNESNTESSGELTTFTSSSSSYRPDIIL